MDRFYDRFGNIIVEDSLVLVHNKACDLYEVTLCGKHQNKIGLFYVNYIMDDAYKAQGFCPLDHYYKNNLINLNVKLFNSSLKLKKNEKKYYDSFGIIILEDMGLFFDGGGAPVERIGNELCVGDLHLSEYLETKKHLWVNWISSKYISQMMAYSMKFKQLRIPESYRSTLYQGVDLITKNIVYGDVYYNQDQRFIIDVNNHIYEVEAQSISICNSDDK